MGKVWQLPSSGSQKQHLALCLVAWLLSFDPLSYLTVGCEIVFLSSARLWLWLDFHVHIINTVLWRVFCANQAASHNHHERLLATPGGVLWMIYLHYRKEMMTFKHFKLFPYICYFILVLHWIGKVHILICILLFCSYSLSASVCRSVSEMYT